MSVSAARNVGVFVATTKIVLLIKCTCINKIGLKKSQKRVPLFKDLLQNGIYTCGTQRRDRKYLPVDMKIISKNGHANRGD